MADDSKKDGGSLLKTSLAFAPLGIGAGITARNVISEGGHIPPKASSMTTSIGDIAPRRMPRIPSSQEIFEFMKKGVVGKPVHGDVAKQAWEWAMMGIDPATREGLLHYTRNIDKMSGTEAIKAIGMTLDTNKSAIMGNVWKRFQANVSLLEEQRNLFGGVPQFNPITAGRVTEKFGGGVPSGIQSRLEHLAKALGGAAPEISAITRPELADSGFAVFHTTLRTELGDLRVSVPNVQQGILFEGGTLQTKRIAPDVLVVGEEGVERLTRSEYFLKELHESIVPDIGTRIKTPRDLEKAVGQLRSHVFGELESVPAVAPDKLTAAQAQYEGIRGQAVDIRIKQAARRIRPGAEEFIPIHRIPTDKELADIMTGQIGKQYGLVGGVGPKAMAQGRLSTVPWEEFDITGGPVEYGRRPEQAYRRFQLTEEATAAMRKHSRLGKYRAYEVAAQALSENNTLGPTLKAVYVNPESRAFAMGGAGEKLERLAMGEGEALMRQGIARQLEFESIETIKLKTLRGDIAEGGFKGLLPGDIIGTTERGLPFRYEEGMNILGMERFESQGMGEFASVAYTKRHEFVHGSKLFGGAKAVTQVRAEDEFRDALKQLTGRNVGADIIINMDELKKNKALHRRQMLTALSDIAAEQMEIVKNKRALRMLKERNISELGAGFVRSATKGGVYDHEAFIRNMMRFATREIEMTPQMFGEVFGAVPAALGEEKAAKLLSETLMPTLPVEEYSKFRQAFFGGTAGGITSFGYAGPAIDVGGLGSLEPRAFEILGQPQFGTMGESLSQEFLERMQMTSPEVIKTHEELGRTLQSMVGDVKGAPATEFVASQGYNAKRIQAMMEEGAFMIKPGKGQRNIYVPSAKALSDEALAGLKGFEMGSGEIARSHMGKIYHDIAYTASQFATGEMPVAQYEKEMGFLADRLRKEWAPFGKGAGAVARGKVLGSTFLRGMSATELGAETAIREAGAVGISEDAFERMARQMEDMGFDMARMRQTFAEGGQVGGMMWRHPQIGGYSMQYVNLQRAAGAGATDVIIPEIGANVRAEVGGEMVEKRLTLGPLVGMAGDKDADAYAVALVSGDREKEIRNTLSQADNAFTTRYTQHQVRMQLLKAKAASDEGLTTVAKMAGDVEKLRAGQAWVGPLSVQLSTAKEALSAGGRGAAAADARALLEWLEQTPISAKHLSAREAAGGGLSAMMETITSAMETRNATRLNEAVRAIVASDAMSTEMLTGNVRLTEGADQVARIMGVNLGENLRGANLETATKELMRTMSDHHANGGMRAYERLVGRGSRIKLTEIPEMIAKGAAQMQATGQGVFNKVSAAMSTSSNTLAQVGRSIIRHHKAIGLGFAGSLALAATLSSPKDTIGPGSGLVPSAKVNMNRSKAANRMSPETMQPPQHAPGTPTPPNMLRGGQARVTTGTPGRRVQVRARAESFVNTAGLAGQVGGLGARSNVNLRDNRTSLLPHEIAGKVL